MVFNVNNFVEDPEAIQNQEITHNLAPKPFVKWAGGKRAIINQLLQKIPKQINNYYEPFLGGGALFFAIYNKVNYSYLSDLNVDLIVAYNVIKTHPKELLHILNVHQQNHNKEYYYNIRALQNLEDPIVNSARFIYLMKTCFNGLYRVNKNNCFNTPMGSYKNPNICDYNNIWAVNMALQNATIVYKDFTKITPNKGDFVYFDPPYYPINNDSFTQYLSSGFNEKDQIKLKDFALELTKAGVNVMLSNSNAEFIVNIYKKYFNISTISAPRVINSNGSKRQSVNEVLITNF